jgi:hypothetical protein
VQNEFFFFFFFLVFFFFFFFFFFLVHVFPTRLKWYGKTPLV